MLGRAVCFLGEFQSGEELYDTLTDQIGLTDDEIREIGFKSLAPFFNRDYYAQTIAEYLIDEGTDKTHSGNYHFSFAEVNERFGTSLPGDKEMLEKIVSALDSEIVADVDATEDFGNATYPQVIDEATLERLRSRKASRNTQTSTDRQSGIYLLKVPIICPSCGNSMHRLQDTRCKCTQKWVCNQCHIQIKKEDTELMEDITTLLNALIQRPEIIRTAQPSQAEPSIEQRRLDNEIARTLEGYDFDKDALREKLYQRASLGYLQIGDEAYVEHKLKNTLEQHDTLDSFDSELTNKTVKLIKLAENGSVSIILINDQEIRKEQTDHANSNPSDAT